ncbi:MAG: CHRD domain-containing protein [Acidimicrobiales bacterium]
MRRRLTISLLAIGILLIPSPALAGTARAGSDIRVLTAQLSGAEEVPGPGDPTASGSFIGKFNAGSGFICYELTYEGTPAIAAHIHRGAAGVAGPVVVPLETPSSGSVNDCASADADLIRKIVSNPAGFYVNVHSAPFPAGSARGQLSS